MAVDAQLGCFEDCMCRSTHSEEAPLDDLLHAFSIDVSHCGASASPGKAVRNPEALFPPPAKIGGLLLASYTYT